eukprot:scaffold37050_cov65-Phaeocystis_antarctica.AAC.2
MEAARLLCASLMGAHLTLLHVRPPRQPLTCQTRRPSARPFSVGRSSRPARCAAGAISLARAARRQSSVNAAACGGAPALSAANPNPSP